MYFEYETKYNLYQRLYRLEKSVIEEWEVREIKCTMKSDPENAESYATTYRIGCVSNSGYNTKLLTQIEIDKEYFKNKADIIKKIADQL